MKTPSGVRSRRIPLITACTSSMCANTFAAVTTRARPSSCSTRSTASSPENAMKVGTPRAWASLPVSIGSTPRTRWPAAWKFESSVPSFQPTSTTRSAGPSPSSGPASAASSAKFSRSMRVVPLVYGYSGGKRIFGSTTRPSWTSSQAGHRRSCAGYAGCSAGGVPIFGIVFTGGRYPTKSSGSSSRLPQDWQRSTTRLEPVPMACVARLTAPP